MIFHWTMIMGERVYRFCKFLPLTEVGIKSGLESWFFSLSLWLFCWCCKRSLGVESWICLFFSLLIFCTTFAVAVFVVMGFKSNILHHLLSDHVANQKHTNLNQNSKHRGKFQALERFWNYALGRDRVFLKRNVVEIFFTWRLPLFDGRSFV